MAKKSDREPWEARLPSRKTFLLFKVEHASIQRQTRLSTEEMRLLQLAGFRQRLEAP